MIEQKLQSNVHPREVSTTSTGRPEQRVATQHAGAAIRQRQRFGGEAGHGAFGIVDERAVPAMRQAGNAVQAAAVFERAEQRPERALALAAHDGIDFCVLVRIGREARVVAAGDDVGLRGEPAHQRRDREGGGALESHDRQPDHVGFALADQAGKGRTRPGPARARGRQSQCRDARRRCRPATRARRWASGRRPAPCARRSPASTAGAPACGEAYNG